MGAFITKYFNKIKTFLLTPIQGYAVGLQIFTQDSLTEQDLGCITFRNRKAYNKYGLEIIEPNTFSNFLGIVYTS